MQLFGSIRMGNEILSPGTNVAVARAKKHLAAASVLQANGERSLSLAMTVIVTVSCESAVWSVGTTTRVPTRSVFAGAKTAVVGTEFSSNAPTKMSAFTAVAASLWMSTRT